VTPMSIAVFAPIQLNMCENKINIKASGE